MQFSTLLSILIVPLALFSCGGESPPVRQEAFSEPILTPDGEDIDPWKGDRTPRRWAEESLRGGLRFHMSAELAERMGLTGNANPVEQMMRVWNGIGIGTFFQTPMGITSNLSHAGLEAYLEDQEMGVYYSDNWFVGSPSKALAVTYCQTAVHTERVGENQWRELYELVHCDIIFNFRNHQFTTNPDDFPFAPKDFASVALHELGHALGLDHDKDPASIMFPTLGSGEVKRTLSNRDKFFLKTLYETPSPSYSRSPASFGRPHYPRYLTKTRTIHEAFVLDANGQCQHFQSSPK